MLLTGVIFVIFFSLLVITVSILLKSRMNYKEIDELYGKPYEAKIIKMIGGHPQLKQGSMALAFHPKDAIAFNRKVFRLSQVNAIKICSKLPHKLKKERHETMNSEGSKQFILMKVRDELGEHEIAFTATTDLEAIANKLMQTWKKYNFLG